MKLSKLYSNKKGFKNIEFNLKGLNIIYADVSTPTDHKKNSHNLGKTLLSRIIDFLLLKGSPNNRFLASTGGTNKFSEYVFYLEIKLNSGFFLTIRRSVRESSKISFSFSNQRTENFIPPQNWDEEELSFAKAKKLLSDYLNFDFFEHKTYDFRKTINYSLRIQGDYSDIYRLRKFSAGKDRDWKPFMFDLLGFKGSILSQKYDLEKEIENIRKIIHELKVEFNLLQDNRDDLVAQVQLKEERVNELAQQIDRFNFYEQDREMIDRGIQEVEYKISELNTENYSLEYDIKQLEVSIKNKFAFDLGKVKRIFDETDIYFPNELAHDYNELIIFNRRLTKERNKLLNANLSQKVNRLEEVLAILKQLNLEKEELLSFIQDSSTFVRFKKYQKDLVKHESELLGLKDRLGTTDKIFEKEKTIDSLKTQLEEIVREIKKEYRKTESNERYRLVRKNFSKYFMSIVGEEAYITWNLNSNNNVEFKPPTVRSSDGERKIDTSQGQGYTYTKLFCVCFDLAIMISYMDQSFFRFIYHDDVLANEDNGVKHSLLNLVRELSTEYDVQYLLSVIKDDLPVDLDEKPILFDESEIVLILHDRDPSGTLFGFEF